MMRLTDKIDKDVIVYFVIVGIVLLIAIQLASIVRITPHTALFWIIILSVPLIDIKYAILIYIIITPFALENTSRLLSFVRFDEIYLIVIILFALMRIAIANKQLFKVRKPLIITVLYAYFVLLSFTSLFAVGNITFRDLFPIVKLVLNFALFLLGFYCVASFRDVKLFIIVVLSISGVVALIGVLQYFDVGNIVNLTAKYYPSPTGKIKFEFREQGVTSILGNPNSCACFLSLSGCILFSAILAAQRINRNIPIILVLLLDIMVILLTKSRSIAISFGIALGLLSIFHRKKLRAFILIPLICIVIYFLQLHYGVFARMSLFYESADDRIQVETRAWNFSKNQLFLGTGPRYDWRKSVWTESTYTKLLSQHGLIGLINFLLISYVAIRIMWTTRKFSNTTNYLSLGLIAWYISMGVAALSGPYLLPGLATNFFWLLLGVLSKTLQFQKRHGNEFPEKVSPKLRNFRLLK